MSQVVIFEPGYDHGTAYKGVPQRSIGIVKGTKLDPNYIVVDLLFPTSLPSVIIYRTRLTFLPLTSSNITNIHSFDDFQQAYPEYFI